MNSIARTPAAALARRFVFGALALLTATGAWAEAVRYYGTGQVPSPLVVAGILGHGQAKQRLKMRGVGDFAEAGVLDDGQVIDELSSRESRLTASAREAVAAWQTRFEPNAVSGRSTPPVRKRAAPVHALAVAINFDNGSAQLQAAALPVLDSIAEGLRMVGFGRPFVIEGHTSATGSRAYNRKLSRLRAESVKRYLVRQHGIPAKALRAVGRGSSAPLDPNDANAEANRRVQFRAA